MFKFEWLASEEWKRFVPWLRRECYHCLYPLSEYVVYIDAPNGKRKEAHCCSICYALRENRYENTSD